jgi:hypothetical protein
MYMCDLRVKLHPQNFKAISGTFFLWNCVSFTVNNFGENSAFLAGKGGKSLRGEVLRLRLQVNILGPAQ